MKTLDEVIKAFEICIGYYCSNAEHDVCPYFGESDMGCMKEPEKDALHYLKEYRETKKHLACLDDAEIRGDNTQVVNNPPLTWDELKSMEGNPVWMEYEDGKGGWVIVGEFFSLFEHEELDAYVYMYYLHNKIECSKELYGSYWKAYRKERS